MIPLCDLKQQYRNLKEQIDDAMTAVAASGHYILGPCVRTFEQEIAKYCGCHHAVGVASGTDALHLALRALGIGPGDEVITTPFTFIATTEAVGLVGAKPVFVDIDPVTFNINPAGIEAAISSRTKAILPVHLYGQPCEMEPILEIANAHSLYVVEDCAQAIGAGYRGRQAGSMGHLGCLSFFPSKNLGCFGDGGAVVTNDTELFEKIEVLRRHGGRVKYHHEELGLNSRLDELQAAILSVKLKHLNTWNAKRRERAYRYNAALQNMAAVRPPIEWRPAGTALPTNCDEASESMQAVYHQYTVLVEDRDRVAENLRQREVACFPYYPVPLHLQQVHADLEYSRGSFPVAESAASRCLSLPMFPELTDQQQDEVIKRLMQVLGSLAVTLKQEVA